MSKVGKGYQIGLSWIPSTRGHIPQQAVEAGSGVYVARAWYQNDLVPGKVMKSDGRAYVSYGGNEYECNEFEVLCDSSLPNMEKCYGWESAENGEVPKKGIVGGVSASGEPQYVARGKINDEWIAGKIHVGHTSGYFPQGGKENPANSYEVLVLKKKKK